jgi:hypothetical protein
MPTVTVGATAAVGPEPDNWVPEPDNWVPSPAVPTVAHGTTSAVGTANDAPPFFNIFYYI